jgi:glycosyltransferase involved in cell wall biosynthesis
MGCSFLSGYIILHIKLSEKRFNKNIVVSAVNLTEGGPLTILQECLGYLSANLSDTYEIIALVNRKKLYPFGNIKYLEFPKSKKLWVNRLYYEYYFFAKLAKRLNPFLWLSLHDITPNVKADRLAVYCHNPSPFYKLSLREAILDPKFALFNTFYRYLYSVNIHKCDFVIVQQNYLRKEFIKAYKLKEVIVAHPNVYDNRSHIDKVSTSVSRKGNFIFFYPALPRLFKNFEVIARSSEILLKQGINNFQVLLTISGDENRYSRYVYNTFKHLVNLKFIGIQSRDNTFELYNNADCIIFPSKLETWGMPITEAKLFRKPLLLADLEYVHETLGTYDLVKFFNPDNPAELANAMKGLIKGTIVFEKAEASAISAPFTQNWGELFGLLLGDKC